MPRHLTPGLLNSTFVLAARSFVGGERLTVSRASPRRATPSSPCAVIGRRGGVGLSAPIFPARGWPWGGSRSEPRPVLAAAPERISAAIPDALLGCVDAGEW